MSHNCNVSYFFQAMDRQVWIFPKIKRDINIEDYYNPENDNRFREKNVYLEVVEADE